jgi:AcrR family transcriptional regulator
VAEATHRPRLCAAERRAAILEAACHLFAQGSYRGTTVAEIACAAGVTEPVLYHHFDCKRDLYLSCIDETWTHVRMLWEQALAAEPDPAEWVRALASTYRESGEIRLVISNLWMQALAESSEDEAIRAFMQRHLREVHAAVADVHRRSQEAGGVLPGREPSVEAWVFIALGLLRTVDDTLGGLVEDEFPPIGRSRHAWLTGRS